MRVIIASYYVDVPSVDAQHRAIRRQSAVSEAGATPCSTQFTNTPNGSTGTGPVLAIPQ